MVQLLSRLPSSAAEIEEEDEPITQVLQPIEIKWGPSDINK